MIVALPTDSFVGRICRANAAGDGLIYTGDFLPRVGLQDRILDVDGDGRPEYLFSGGESGLGYYAALTVEDTA